MFIIFFFFYSNFSFSLFQDSSVDIFRQTARVALCPSQKILIHFFSCSWMISQLLIVMINEEKEDISISIFTNVFKMMYMLCGINTHITSKMSVKLGCTVNMHSLLICLECKCQGDCWLLHNSSIIYSMYVFRYHYKLLQIIKYFKITSFLHKFLYEAYHGTR